jgi:DNA repair exonuclease SbcCD nuclease subunit
MVLRNNGAAPFEQNSGESCCDAQGVRVLHASDLHLERVPAGLTEIPDQLRPQLIDASYAAARRVFEAAITESVDAVLLAGDVVDLSLAGPRAIVFLRDHFERLAADGIKVFWAGGSVDPPHAWPKVSPLPANVHVFPADHAESFELRRGGEVVACIWGISAGEGVDGRPNLSRLVAHDVSEIATIGVAFGDLSQADLDKMQFHYFASGGRHARKSFASADKSRLLHYPGTTLGISPEEAGPRGATLVNFDAAGAVHLRPVPTDVFRWETPQIEFDEATNVAELERQLVARAEGLRASAGAAHLLVRWQITGRGPLLTSLRKEEVKSRIVRVLRERFGRAEPGLWTAGIEVSRALDLPQGLFQEETIRGDVLREIQTMRERPPASLDLATYLAAADRKGPLAHRLSSLAPERYHMLLDETSDHCVALLSGNPS